MKLNGFVGKGTGKLGSSVFAVSGGEQIVRQYNPNVSNPNTDAQVEQRAKLKLLSQLAAALAPAIAIKKSGLVSARNKFVSINYPFTTYENDEAVIDTEKIQLTEGAIDLGAFTAERTGNTAASVNYSGVPAGSIDKVVYVSVVKTPDGKLMVLGTTVAEEGQSHDFAASVTIANLATIIYAYGIKFNSSAAKIRFEDYLVNQTNYEAALGVAIPSALANGTTTKTSANTVAPGA